MGSVIRDIRGQLLKGRVLYFDSLENMVGFSQVYHYV